MALRISQLALEVIGTNTVQSGILVSASTTLTFGYTATGTVPVHNVSAVSSIQFVAAVTGGGDFEVTASNNLIVSANGFVYNPSKYVSAGSSLVFSTTPYIGNTYAVVASSAFVVGQSFSSSIGPGPVSYSVAASSSLNFSGSMAYLSAQRTYYVSASTTITLGYEPTQALWGNLLAPAYSGLILASSASAVKIANATATTSISLGISAVSARDINVSASTSLGFASSQGSNRFDYGTAASIFAITILSTGYIGGTPAASGFILTHKADATVVLPPGGGVPGGCQSGLRTVLLADVSGEFPFSFAETPSGLILVANGIDPIQRWDGLSGTADTAGLCPPSQAIELGGSGLGKITGRRVAYVRYIDQYGNVSNLSPVSNGVDFGRDGRIDRIVVASGVVTITSPGHCLMTGDPVLIEGVNGLGINGSYTITVVNDDQFSLNNLAAIGTWKGGGRWIMGIQTVVYGNVQTPADLKVVRRQIIRNLDGNSETFYVDIDTTDVTNTAFSSTKSDEQLLAGLPVPLFTANETPQANRYGVPPSHKAIVAAHLGRIFAAGDVSYTKGNCQPVFGQSRIIGIGTAWRKSMVGRLIYMTGASNSYEIASVDEVNQTITTTSLVLDALGPFTSYAIRPAPGERKFVYFSEPALPEAWPPWNAISLPEDGDDITGLLIKGSFLYILEQRHVYKFTFQSDPARDGFVFLTTQRGCVNNRCYVQVEDTVYLLDEIGIYAFNGQESEPVSTPIQTIFQQANLGGLQVNWQADQRYWHAAHDPVKDTIRWFVAMTGFEQPRHAIAYDYRRKRFWLEEYPFVVTSSTVGTIGFRRSLAGSDARRVLCLGEGSLDTVDSGNGLRGSVSSAGPLTLTDSSAPFPANLAGAPVSIAEGKGFGQQRRVVSNTSTTIKVDRPWLVQPNTTSVYQVGGINWTWQSGWFRFADEQEDNSRDVEVIFQPLKNPSSVGMRMYFDHHTEPKRWARSIEQDGVTIIEGQPEVIVDMKTRSGFAAHRFTGHRDPTAPGERYVSVEITGVQARDPQRVYSVTVNGVRQQ
jgi:hypothetical protein